ncbi:hypothetical protein CAPTEDRAFT_211752 [Capitella teleta]|uniref:Uncharacterized protein n=1 Tax=Capitella teleta TaxID=283909 RepID=R7T4C8_CAPTE|nr:hypothetical protein CAPTEDRAFT_211752 [Capitella teleta]|eukprot:ELT87733.1 hypothetical protein CAPTEDRAFT_211752 [Capitella teleta]
MVVPPEDPDQECTAKQSPPSASAKLGVRALVVEIEKELPWIKTNAYMKMLKRRLYRKPHVYLHFLEILQEVQKQRRERPYDPIDYAGVMKRAKKLLQGDPNLMPSIDIFLPPGC